MQEVFKNIAIDQVFSNSIRGSKPICLAVIISNFVSDQPYNLTLRDLLKMSSPGNLIWQKVCISNNAQKQTGFRNDCAIAFESW